MGLHEVLRGESDATLRLTGAWTVEHAAALRRELLDLLAATDVAYLDVAGVEAVDASLFEVVHAACMSAARDAKRIQRVGPLSDAARQAARVSGFMENGLFAEFWKDEERHDQDDHDR
ncbi:STAS domain-containing protein [Desulfovibrio sulfodismutans]|uniref:STAS domain-containing protein n=1 Tax=Desulfolutivibrio sulfodismutans TaxID=63561 RepID=A0A7K3NPF6_9BACT|nr:STAS domain-containing protein [Desulfolutivibrio sulfodismutans]NDY57089.1 STAS domain-containing protein [Desulfolutivibrio sulfodismutans]